MADRPLRPATDRGLGEPLPHQLANRARAPLRATLSFIADSEESAIVCGISTGFPVLFPTPRQITHVVLTRAPLYSGTEVPFLARLACVRHAASVDSEPGSNSQKKFLKVDTNWLVRPKTQLQIRLLGTLSVVKEQKALSLKPCTKTLLQPGSSKGFEGQKKPPDVA